MSNKFEAAKQIYKGGKYVFETVVPKIAKNLKERFDTKQKAFKSIDEKGEGLSLQKRSEIKKSFSGKASKIFDDASKKRKEFKRGTGLRRPSNVEKIKKAFGPKQKPQTRMTGKKKKFPDLTGDGKVTFADILKGRGVINGKKKEKGNLMAGKGLYANIHAKRKRGGKMRKKGAKGAPKASDFKRAKQTARS